MLFSCSSSNEQPSTPNASLTNTRWVLRALNDKKVFTPESGKEAYISLTKLDKRLSGNGGCNTMFSTYTLDGNNIKFGVIASTEMYCAQMETETAFLKALEKVVKYRIKGDTLYLYDSVGMIAKLEAVYFK